MLLYCLYCIVTEVVFVYCVFVGQSDGGEVINVGLLEHCSLDLTRVNQLLSVLSRKKQLLEQVQRFLFYNSLYYTVIFLKPKVLYS